MKKRGIFVLVLLFLVTFFPGQLRALDLDYLRQNSELLSGEPEFELLLPGLEGKKIILAGEAHGVGINSELVLELLTFLHGKADVRYFLWEGGYALGSLLNNYLQGGEEELLDLVFTQLEGTAFWSKEQYFFFKKLAEFNEELPPGKRVGVVGIDLELPLTSAIIFLGSLLGKETPESLKPLEEMAGNHKKLEGESQLYSSRVRLETMQMAVYLQEIIELEGENLQEFLGEDWFAFQYGLRRLIQTHETWGEGPQVREENTFSNLLELAPHLERGNFFGQWGGNHVLQRNHSQVNWLGSFLNGPRSPWAGQVLSIYYVYDHCKRMDPRTYQARDYTSEEIRDLAVLRRAAPAEISLFWLDAPGSPFREEIHFLTRHSGGVTTDYFQYLIMIRNQSASNPLRKTED